MSNDAIIYRMASGIAGDVTRREHAAIEGQVQDATIPCTLYGIPVKMVSGKITQPQSGFLAAEVYGLSVRPFPIQPNSSEALGAGTPPTEQLIDIMRRGYMTVKCQNGTPTKNGQVYFRSTNAAVYAIGGIEAAAAGGECVALTGAFFMGEADADGNVEISYNIQ